MIETAQLLPFLLVAQGVIGGVDTLLNHELIARLPHKVEARTEIGLHVLREAVYGMLFATLAWFAWHGAWAILIGALIAAAILIDMADEFVENRSRILPQNERMLHFLLILNLGLLTIVLGTLLPEWLGQSTELAPAGHGLLAWVLSALATAAIGWSVRDFLAWLALRKAARKQALPV